MPENDTQRFVRVISEACSAMCFLQDEVNAGNISKADAKKVLEHAQGMALYGLFALDNNCERRIDLSAGSI